MAIVNRIRILRAADDRLTQAQLARLTGISRQTLNAIERGHRVPTLEVAHRIADALRCSLDEVFHYEPELPMPSDNDGELTITVWLDDERDWWKAHDVSRVTTSAKRCSDAAP